MNNISRMKYLKINSISSILYTLFTLASGLILPRLIIVCYGSAVNGLLNSINQFLQVFTFLELGMSSVTISALYSPVANGNKAEINNIVTSATRFYRILGFVLAGYVVILTLVYPLVVKNSFEITYTTVLIVAYSASLFAQYFFGIVDRCILDAHQVAYVFYSVQAVSVALNVIISIILIYAGASIQTVKLATAFIYIIRPVVIRVYIHRNFDIRRNVRYEDEPIKQKWNGVAQHISYIIINSTDTVLLTLFTSLEMVSVYSVYNMVVAAINQVISALFTSSSATMGNMYANNEIKVFSQFFRKLEVSIHAVATIAFSCTLVLIEPFVMVYTRGVSDIQYRQEVFAVVITIANFFWCLRLPYALVISACGKYRETQKYFIATAMMNVFISVLLVNSYGLVGVAIGTLISMLFQFVALSNYVSRNILERKTGICFKQLSIDVLIMCSLYGATRFFQLDSETYLSWFVRAVLILLLSCVISLIAYSIFCPKKVKKLFQRINKIKR